MECLGVMKGVYEYIISLLQSIVYSINITKTFVFHVYIEYINDIHSIIEKWNTSAGRMAFAIIFLLKIEKSRYLLPASG